MKKRLGCGLFALILLIFGAIWAIDNVLPYSIIRPWKHAATQKPADFGLISEEISWKGFGEIALNGWLILAKSDTISQNYLLFCHGIAGNRSHFLSSAAKASAAGWHCLLLDGRAHGESGGDFCTFGYFEEKDLKLVVDSLEKRFPKIGKIGIWGASLGGAIALQCLENDERLDFGIIESTFTDLPTIISDYQKQLFFSIRIPPASQKALKKAGEIGQFEPETVRPLDAAKNIEQPMLMIHGDADEKISFKYGRQIFENLASPKKSFLPVKGAHHNDVHTKGGADLEREIAVFLTAIAAIGH
jgi:uncharacterized protein